MADVYESCSLCDGEGVVEWFLLTEEQQNEIADYATEEGETFDPDDNDLFDCPECEGEGEVYLGWEEPAWSAEGFDSKEDWKDNTF